MEATGLGYLAAGLGAALTVIGPLYSVDDALGVVPSVL